MLDAIKELGDYVKQKENLSGVEIFVDKAKLDKRTEQVLCILFKRKNDTISYNKVLPPEDYESRKAFLCLYRRGSSRGVNISPSALVTKEIESTFENKIVNWFKNREDTLSNAIKRELENKKNEIKKELGKRYNEIPEDKRTNVLLTLKLEEDGEEKYVGQVPIFKEIFMQDTLKRYYLLKTIGESKGRGSCYICGNLGEVFGFVLPSFGFSFSTADKKGFSPDFIQRDQWKEIPICKDCTISLEIGKRFLDENVSFPKRGYGFFGCKYYVIPKFIFGEIFEEIYNYIKYFEDKEYEKGLLSKEDRLEEMVKDKEDVLRLIFLFYKQKGGGAFIDIVRYVEDVLPSWIKKMHDCQENVKKTDALQEENMRKILGKEWIGDFVNGRIGKERDLGRNNWVVKFTRDFFPSSRTEGVYDKYFMDVISSILSKTPIDKDFMISSFVKRMRSTFKKKDSYGLKILSLKAFMLYLFLSKMNLLRGEKVADVKTIEKIRERDLASKVEQFFEEYGFDHPAKRAAFSIGMFIDYLLWVQRKERGAGFGEEPFWSSLYGLVLDEKKVKGLFPKALGKIRQYRRGYPTLETIVSKYLAKAEQNWDISNDEISYYFVLGMTWRGTFLEYKKERGAE